MSQPACTCHVKETRVLERTPCHFVGARAPIRHIGPVFRWTVAAIWLEDQSVCQRAPDTEIRWRKLCCQLAQQT